MSQSIFKPDNTQEQSPILKQFSITNYNDTEPYQTEGDEGYWIDPNAAKLLGYLFNDISSADWNKLQFYQHNAESVFKYFLEQVKAIPIPQQEQGA